MPPGGRNGGGANCCGCGEALCCCCCCCCCDCCCGGPERRGSIGAGIGCIPGAKYMGISTPVTGSIHIHTPGGGMPSPPSMTIGICCMCCIGGCGCCLYTVVLRFCGEEGQLVAGFLPCCCCDGCCCDDDGGVNGLELGLNWNDLACGLNWKGLAFGLSFCLLSDDVVLVVEAVASVLVLECSEPVTEAESCFSSDSSASSSWSSLSSSGGGGGESDEMERIGDDGSRSDAGAEPVPQLEIAAPAKRILMRESMFRSSNLWLRVAVSMLLRTIEKRLSSSISCFLFLIRPCSEYSLKIRANSGPTFGAPGSRFRAITFSISPTSGLKIGDWELGDNRPIPPTSFGDCGFVVVSRRRILLNSFI